MRRTLVIDGLGDDLSSRFLRWQTEKAWGHQQRARTDQINPSDLASSLSRVDRALVTGSWDNVMKNGQVNLDSIRLKTFIEGAREFIAQILQEPSDDTLKVFAECWGAQAMAVLLFMMSESPDKELPIRQLGVGRKGVHAIHLQSSHSILTPAMDQDDKGHLFYWCGQAVDADRLRELEIPGLKILAEEQETDGSGQDFSFASAWCIAESVLCIAGHVGYPIHQKWHFLKSGVRGSRTANKINLALRQDR